MDINIGQLLKLSRSAEGLAFLQVKKKQLLRQVNTGEAPASMAFSIEP